jgi:CBS domain-containing protein
VATRLLYISPDREQRALPWKAVMKRDWRHRRLAVKTFDQSEPAPSESLGRAVLLKRDVLDALVLDLATRQATRANDLWLREENGDLLLRGADVSPWAVVRRLGAGLLGHGSARRLLDWREVEFLRGDPAAARAGRDYHRRIERLPPPEIGRLLDAIPYMHAAELLTLIPDPSAADTLEWMTTERQLQVFEELPDDQANRLLALMAPELAADLLGRLDPGLAKAHLEALPADRHDLVVDLLRYPETTAGGIMTNDIVLARDDMTVREARQWLRDRLRSPDFVYYVYVVDDLRSRRLQGVLTLRDLLVADEAQRLGEIMQHGTEALKPLEGARGSARRVVESEYLALPVVSDDGRLLGAVTVDAAMREIAPLGGQEPPPRVFS